MDDPGREHIQLLLRVARLYYEENLGQAEIAQRVGYSRSRVSRLLTEARAAGVVRIQVGHPLERTMALEAALVDRFGLRAARVVAPRAGESALTAVAHAGADVLVEQCRDATVLAVSAGTTVDALVEELPLLALRDLHVVQMIGTLARRNPLIDSTEIARRVAERLGGDYRVLPAPLIVGSARLARALQHEESVANALALAGHADVALLGIGAVDQRGTSGQIFDDWLTSEERRGLVQRGAVGHLSAHHFDAAGRHVCADVCDRIMAVPLDRIRGIRTVIGVATGAAKLRAVRGALLGRYLDVLVTDAATAQGVLREDATRTAAGASEPTASGR